EVDFATEDFHHHRIYVRFATNDEGTFVVKEIKYGSLRIGLNDSCFKTTEKLNQLFLKKEPTQSENYFEGEDDNGETIILEQFKKFKFFVDWYYLISETKESTAGISGFNKDSLERIFRTLDSSIIGVSEMQETNENQDADKSASVFLIRFKNSDSIVLT